MFEILLAEIVLGPAHFGMGIGGVAVGLLGMWLRQRVGVAPAAANPVAGQVLDLAFDAHKENLGPFANLFRAIAANDKPTLAQELVLLGRAFKEKGSSFANLLENFVHARIPVLLADDTDRRELFARISATEGVDVQAAIDQAKAQKTNLAAAAVKVASAILLALCLALGNTASARGPERFEPTDTSPVIDSPVFAGQTRRSVHKPLAALGRPQGAGCFCQGACDCGPHCNCSTGYESTSARAGFWQRGCVRRGLSAVGRFVWRRLPFRKCG